jgi:hypothetical protein
MVALAQTFSRLSGRDVDVESLKAVVALSSTGLLISFFLIIWGLDVVPF